MASSECTSPRIGNALSRNGYCRQPPTFNDSWRREGAAENSIVGNHRNQIPRDFNPHQPDDGPTLIASEFDIIPLDDRHKATAAIDTG